MCGASSFKSASRTRVRCATSERTLRNLPTTSTCIQSEHDRDNFRVERSPFDREGSSHEFRTNDQHASGCQGNYSAALVRCIDECFACGTSACASATVRVSPSRRSSNCGSASASMLIARICTTRRARSHRVTGSNEPVLRATLEVMRSRVHGAPKSVNATRAIMSIIGFVPRACSELRGRLPKSQCEP